MKANWIVALCAALPLAAAHAEVDKKTERTWKAKCASCHGANGKGQTDQGKKMGIADYTAADRQKMDPFKDKLDAAQIDSLVGYVRSLK